MNSAIGIDVGGTKIAVGLGLPSGKQIASLEIPTHTGRLAGTSVDQIKVVTAKFIEIARQKKTKLRGIGVCIPGAVDPVKGTVPHSPNLPGWEGIPLKKILESKFHLPVRMANDAKAVAVAENVFGQGKGLQNFIYLTVSTGIGSGIFSRGKLLEGASFSAGESGHMVIVSGGDPCLCGNKGCLEAYASGTAMAKFAAAEIKKGKYSKVTGLLSPGETLTARVLGKAAKAGDVLALEAYARGGYYLGIGLANLLNILNPEKLILGGGVFSSAPPLFFKKMMTSVRAHAWPEAFRAVKIVRTKLKGHTGALALVFENKK
ncbi:MAG: ROK family protein [Candidatus Omnitrophica bacterium]|nr:ROK family protein [Candidatus Omnitrophota bacterium]